MKIPENVLSWLLEENNPAVRYRTLTELLDYAQDHSKVIETQKKIIDSQPVKNIFSQIDCNGEWPWSGSYDSPELGIGYLGELWLDSTKSCIRGSKNVLLLFAELPDLWETDECQKLVGYFLDRKVFFKRNDHTQFARGYPFTVYPFHYRFGILEPVYALSKMGFGKHASLSEAWDFLEEKKDETGKFMLDWTMPRCAFNPGKKGNANKWVTLYAYLSKKQVEN
jgi:hypothetical protein